MSCVVLSRVAMSCVVSSHVVTRRVESSHVVTRVVSSGDESCCIETSGNQSCCVKRSGESSRVATSRRVESCGDEINNILKHSLEDKKITMLRLPLINEDNFSSSYPPFSFYVPLTVKQHN